MKASSLIICHLIRKILKLIWTSRKTIMNCVWAISKLTCFAFLALNLLIFLSATIPFRHIFLTHYRSGCFSIFSMLLSPCTWTQALAKRGGGLGWISICSDKRELNSVCLLFFFYLFRSTIYSTNLIQPLFASIVGVGDGRLLSVRQYSLTNNDSHN